MIVALEVNSDKAIEKITKIKKAQVSDFLVETFSNCDISNVDTKKGRVKLKDVIKEGLNKIITEESVVKVYFTEFVTG